MKKVLILSGHRYPERSRICEAGGKALGTLPNVTVHNLMNACPDFVVDVKREQQLLKAHDVVVMMFPFWWYSSPAILKEWQDQVLEYGFAYGSEGKALHGKPFMVMTSTGGNEVAYTPQGYNRYAVDDLLLPFRAMANLTGMIWQTPALIQGANNISDNGIDRGVNHWLTRLDALLID
ncbi:oxidoreductase [Enterobacter sp. CGMCC 5087]|uniref:NAD(P)H-dependent oxidoreductase n=1 Tax=Enterobacter sp. CGMCC 5087 TaxID=2183878 RepID=UPI000D6738E4|nr:NAD(P)H-dependent oxidoreductase [Enterobacter sp. CGMCC 5087]PWI81104.1 oxidoreductase [Enterobacter sp. CGMCC 5087]